MDEFTRNNISFIFSQGCQKTLIKIIAIYCAETGIFQENTIGLGHETMVYTVYSMLCSYNC